MFLDRSGYMTGQDQQQEPDNNSPLLANLLRYHTYNMYIH